MKAAIIGIAALQLLLGVAFAQNDVVYKWVDEDGIPQYTDRPPMDVDAQPTGIKSRRTNPAAVQARVDAQSDSNAARSQRRQEEAEDAAAAEDERMANLKQREENCKQARQQAETYETSRRLYRPLPNGEREYLTDEELDKARADARASVREWCD
ncbi:MAG: DUF4124 domain-containing protein [Gammaproteobacteria bacterium]|nr:DUF4124 domain-containing protein [Gammaproteobacteria bacterium]